jgi:glucokinase
VRVGIDVGGTKLLAVAIDGTGRVVGERKMLIPRAGPGFARTLAAVARHVAGGALTAVGVGVPGMVDGRGRLVFSPHQPGLVGLDLAGDLSRVLAGVPVWVGNDANCAGWAEHGASAPSGSAAGDLLVVTLGTGIGGAILAGGRLWEGAHRFAGEIGHMIVDAGGALCACGQHGCWEQMASGAALGRLGRRRAEEGRAPAVLSAAGGYSGAVQGEHVTLAAAAGDTDAVGMVVEYAGWLALGLANLANVLDPATVVIGGGLAQAGEVLMGPVRAAFARLVEGYPQRRGLTLATARLGERAGAVGAALLAGPAGDPPGPAGDPPGPAGEPTGPPGRPRPTA